MRTNLEVYGTVNITPIPKEICNERISILERKLEELMLCHWTNQDTKEIKQTGIDLEFWKRMRDEEGI